jgi:hypothetical protein
MLQIKYAALHGGKELEAVLKALPDALARNGLSQAGRAGARVLQDQAYIELNAAIKGGGPRPADDVIIKKLRPPKGSGVQVVYGVGPPTRKPWLRWLHDGTRLHLIAARHSRVLRDDQGTYFGIITRHPGTPPIPWLKQAQFASQAAVLAASAVEMRPALAKQVRRLASWKFAKRQLKRIFG